MRIIYREIIEYIITLQMKRHAHGTRRHARLWNKTLSGYNDTPHLVTPCVGFYLGLWISSAYGGPQRYCFGVLLFCFVLAKKLLYLYFVWSNEWFFFFCSGAIHNLLPQCKWWEIWPSWPNLLIHCKVMENQSERYLWCQGMFIYHL